MSLHLREEFDPAFGRRERIVQRIGWVAIALVLVAAIAGLFGSGLLSGASTRTAGAGHEVEVTYERFGRAQSNLELAIEVLAPGQTATDLSLTISGSLRDKWSVTSISPQPASEAVEGDATVYTWEVNSWSGPVTVRFQYEMRDWRQVGADLEVRAGEQVLGELRFTQFLFP